MDIEKIKAKLKEKCKESTTNKLILAQSLFTPEDILEELCNLEDLEINSELLRNENIKEELRKKAEDTRKIIEKKIIEDDETLHNLIYEMSGDIEKLIYDEHTSSETLTVLYEHVEEIVDETLPGYFIPSDYEDEKRMYEPEEFEEFIDNSSDMSREQLKLSFFEAFIDNPNTPKEIKEEIIEKMKYMPIEEIYKEFYGVYNIHNVQDILNRLEKTASKNDKENNKEKEQKEAEKLLNGWNEDDYNIIKEDEDFGGGMYSYYAELAKNPYTPKEILEKLFELDFMDFSEEFLSNSSLTYEMILRVSEQEGYSIENKEIALALAKNKETPTDVIKKLEDSEHIEVLLALLEREERENSFSKKVVMMGLKSGVSNNNISNISNKDKPNIDKNQKPNSNTLTENDEGEKA